MWATIPSVDHTDRPSSVLHHCLRPDGDDVTEVDHQLYTLAARSAQGGGGYGGRRNGRPKRPHGPAWSAPTPQTLCGGIVAKFWKSHTLKKKFNTIRRWEGTTCPPANSEKACSHVWTAPQGIRSGFGPLSTQNTSPYDLGIKIPARESRTV